MRMGPFRAFMLFFALSQVPAHGQIGLFATAAPTFVHNGASAQTAAYGGTNSGYATVGVGLGVYGEIPLGPVGLGGTFRGMVAPNTSQALVGVHVSAGSGRGRGYVEGLIGAIDRKSTYNETIGDFAAGFAVGADYAIRPHLDWRVVEFTYTSPGKGISTDPNAPSPHVLTVGSGISWRLNGRSRR